jgi:tetratricopeptide (TPR) repeat protein
MRFLLYPLLKPMSGLQPFKVIRIVHKIKALEKENNYKKANIIRKKWLLRVEEKNSAPLWRSEGNYQLYQKKNYEKALKAFQNAINALKKMPLNFGASDPLNVYYGATVSAISLNQNELAREYFSDFQNIYESIDKNLKLQKYLLPYAEGIEWIKDKIEIEN